MDYRDIDRKNILELLPEDAKSFLLKENSYCNFNLPPYFSFEKVIQKTDNLLSRYHLNELSEMIPEYNADGTEKLKSDGTIKYTTDDAKNYEDVNYKLFNNKDGTFSWRQFQLINPLLYVDMVNLVTYPQNWELLLKYFSEIRKISIIECVSIPVVSDTSKTDQAEQVLNYWSEFEQKSIELSLKYNYVMVSDITDCYGSIYTHSIPWALHGKDYSKAHKREGCLGNKIDCLLQKMSYGQTNGIPQGSVLMDLIAEIVLAYADKLLKEKIQNIEKIHILRYRDDYRIFVKNYEDGMQALKILTEVLLSLGLRLNSNKTYSSADIISASIKKDKLHWMYKWNDNLKLQKRLLTIYGFAKEYPNCGTLLTLLTKFYKDIKNKLSIKNTLPLISVVTQIAYENPRAYPIAAALISKLLNYQSNTNDKSDIINDIKNKFSQLPNVSYMNVWLQRISYFIDKSISYTEPLCMALQGVSQTLWNFSWLKEEYQKQLEEISIINQDKLREISSVIPLEEVDLFAYDDDVSDIFDEDDNDE